MESKARPESPVLKGSRIVLWLTQFPKLFELLVLSVNSLAVLHIFSSWSVLFRRFLERGFDGNWWGYIRDSSDAVLIIFITYPITFQLSIKCGVRNMIWRGDRVFHICVNNEESLVVPRNHENIQTLCDRRVRRADETNPPTRDNTADIYSMRSRKCHLELLLYRERLLQNWLGSTWTSGISCKCLVWFHHTFYRDEEDVPSEDEVRFQTISLTAYQFERADRLQ